MTLVTVPRGNGRRHRSLRPALAGGSGVPDGSPQLDAYLTGEER